MKKLLFLLIVLFNMVALASCGKDSNEATPEPSVPVEPTEPGEQTPPVTVPGQQTPPVTEPTPHECVASGEILFDENDHWYECECGEIVEKNAHSFDEGEITTNPTCTTTGVMTFSCECGYSYTEEVEVDPTAHTPGTELLFDENNHWYTCECGEKVSETLHSHNEGVVTTNPTCLTKGVKTFSCECGHYYTEEVEIDPTAHTPSDEWFSDEEKHWHVCECGNISHEEVHQFAENTSYEVNICSICDEVVTGGNYAYLESIGVDPEEAHNAYQVLIYSYYDSDGDGYGDLAGLESKLDYIKGLGADIIWLSPIMESESYHAYDITSFYKIDPKIGTIDDYLSLVNAAHKKNMKIVLDMPINHTSINHEWFIEYLNGNPDYAEYYQEKDPFKIYGNTSSMGNKARFYTDATTKKTYFAAFGETMPDLNYTSDALVSAIYDVFDYWVALGADGFRFDAVKHIFDPNEIDSKEDSVTMNNQLFRELGNHLKSINPNIYLLGENFSGQGEVLQYATSFDAEFDFESWHTGLGAVTNQDPWGQNDRRKYFDDTIVGCTNELIGANPNWIATFMTGNHDVTRAASYIGDKVTDKDAALKLYAALIMLRSGIPFIYYGDELGMYGENKSGDYWVEDSQLRLPMSFSDSTISLTKVFYTKMVDTQGNLTGKTLGENMLADWPDYKTAVPSAEAQMADPNSLYNTYKSLIEFRSSYPQIYKGTMGMFGDYSGQGTIMTFTYEGVTLYVAFNFSETALHLANIAPNADLTVLYSLNGAQALGTDINLPARGVLVFTTASELTENPGAGAFDANYGLVITHTDGTRTIVPLQPWEEFDGYSQHKGDDVKVEVGDVITLIDFYNGNAEWAEDTLDPYGEYQKFSSSAAGITCNQAGTYDFYVKFKFQQDQIYIGPYNG